MKRRLFISRVLSSLAVAAAPISFLRKLAKPSALPVLPAIKAAESTCHNYTIFFSLTQNGQVMPIGESQLQVVLKDENKWVVNPPASRTYIIGEGHRIDVTTVNWPEDGAADASWPDVDARVNVQPTCEIEYIAIGDKTPEESRQIFADWKKSLRNKAADVVL